VAASTVIKDSATSASAAKAGATKGSKVAKKPTANPEMEQLLKDRASFFGLGFYFP